MEEKLFHVNNCHLLLYFFEKYFVVCGISQYSQRAHTYWRYNVWGHRYSDHSFNILLQKYERKGQFFHIPISVYIRVRYWWESLKCRASEAKPSIWTKGGRMIGPTIILDPTSLTSAQYRITNTKTTHESNNHTVDCGDTDKVQWTDNFRTDRCSQQRSLGFFHF